MHKKIEVNDIKKGGKKLEILKKIVLFKNFTEKDFESLYKNIKIIKKKFNKNKTIIFRGENYESLFILRKGSTKGEMINANGKNIIVEDLKAPNILAPAFVFGTNNFFPVNMIACEEIEIMEITKPELLKLCKINEKFLINYLDLISNKAFFLTQRIWFNFSNETIRAKLANYLLDKAVGNKIILENSIKDIATFFGVERPSLSRVLKEFIDKKIIKRISKKEIEILNLEELKKNHDE